MALVTTLMTGPLMRLIDPHNSFGTPPEDGAGRGAPLTFAGRPPTRAILVAPQSEAR